MCNLHKHIRNIKMQSIHKHYEWLIKQLKLLYFNLFKLLLNFHRQFLIFGLDFMKHQTKSDGNAFDKLSGDYDQARRRIV